MKKEASRKSWIVNYSLKKRPSFFVDPFERNLAIFLMMSHLMLPSFPKFKNAQMYNKNYQKSKLTDPNNENKNVSNQK